MENPDTWTKATWTISEALSEVHRQECDKVIGLSPARIIEDALRKEGLLSDTPNTPNQTEAAAEHPRADCEGCNEPTCPCNARNYEGAEAVAYSDGFTTGREVGYNYCGSCNHAWEGHDGECKAYMPDGSICGCRKVLIDSKEADCRGGKFVVRVTSMAKGEKLARKEGGLPV